MIYRSEKRIDGRIFLLLHEFRHHVVRKFKFPVLQPSGKQLFTLSRNLIFRFVQCLADLVLGFRGNDVVYPVRRRLLVLSAHDFHDVSGFELLFYGNSLAVDFSTRAASAEIGVDIECEIQDG